MRYYVNYYGLRPLFYLMQGSVPHPHSTPVNLHTEISVPLLTVRKIYYGKIKFGNMKLE